jgi:hypothetical protein
LKLVFKNDGKPVNFDEFRAGVIHRHRHASDAVAADSEAATESAVVE